MLTIERRGEDEGGGDGEGGPEELPESSETDEEEREIDGEDVDEPASRRRFDPLVQIDRLVVLEPEHRVSSRSVRVLFRRQRSIDAELVLRSTEDVLVVCLVQIMIAFELDSTSLTG